MTANPTSRRPYLVRAMHEWMTDNGQTPHLVVDAAVAGVEVPRGYAKDGRVILNVSWQATQGLKLGNDLIADVLPPPAYVIESFLEATLAMVDVKTLAERRSRIEELKKSYDERKAFWKDSDLDAPLKRLIVERSDVEVQTF